MAAPAAASEPGNAGAPCLKRRRPSNGGIGDEDADSSIPSAQRPRLTLPLLAPVVGDEKEREKWRSQITICFNTYTSLLSLEHSPDAETLQSLIEKAKGSCPSRRLASRIIPRFIHKFPSLVDKAATLLLELHRGGHQGPDDVPVLAQATKADALRGLGNVLGAATKLGDKALPSILRIVDYLLRQLGLHVAQHPDVKPVPVGSALLGRLCLVRPASTAADVPDVTCLMPGERAVQALKDALPTIGCGESDFVVIQYLVVTVFKLYPKVLLSTCLQTFKSSDKVQFQGAHWACGNLLLASYSNDSGEVECAASDGGSTEAAGKDNRGTGHVNGTKQHLLNGMLRAHPANANGTAVGDAPASCDKGNAAGPTGVSPADSSTTCLAEVVLSGLPDIKQWLKGAIINLSKDRKMAAVKEVHAHIDKLLRMVAPPPPPPAPEPPPQPPSQPEGSAAGTEAGTSGAALVRGSQDHLAGQNSVAPGAAPGSLGSPARGGQLQGAGSGSQLVLPGSPDPYTRDSIGPGSRDPGGTTASRFGSTRPGSRFSFGPPQAGAGGAEAPAPQGLPIPETATPGPAGEAAAAAAGVLTPLAIRGGPVTRADCCLFIANLPIKATPESVYQLCNGFDVISVHLGPGMHVSRGEAFVVFSSVKEAAMCAEAIANKSAPWGGLRPIHVEFCPGLPLECPTRATEGPGRQASSYVWCAGQLSPEAIVGAIREGGYALPTALLRVQGGMPGFLLDMPSPSGCQPVVELLVKRFCPPGTQPPPHLLPPGVNQGGPLEHTAGFSRLGSSSTLATPLDKAGSGAGSRTASGALPPHMQQASPAAPAAAAPGPLGGSTGASGRQSGFSSGPPVAPRDVAPGAYPGQPGPSPSPAVSRGPSETVGAGARAEPQGAGLEGAPSPLLRTLWIGQLHDSVSEQELLATFRRHGEIVSHRLLRFSHCAFIDFATHQGAAAAKRAMHGTRVGPQPLRVEWKVEHGRGGAPGPGPPGSFRSPPPWGWGGPADSRGPPDSNGPGGGPVHPSGGGPPSRGGWASGGQPGLHRGDKGGIEQGGAPPALHHRPATGFSGGRGGAGENEIGGPGGHRSRGFSDGPPDATGAISSRGPVGNNVRPGSQFHDDRGWDAGPSEHRPRSREGSPMDWQGPGARGPPGFQPPPHYGDPGHHMRPSNGSSTGAAAAAGGGFSAGPVGAELHQRGSSGGSGPPPWSGTLAKSGAPVCVLVCTDIGISPAAGSQQEPLGWPAMLDVKLRADLGHVISVLFTPAPLQQRAVRRLLPANPAEDAQRLADFVRYLADKGRAGVIKLEGQYARSLYLVPPSSSVCQSLGVSWEPIRDAAALLAVVVPAAAPGMPAPR